MNKFMAAVRLIRPLQWAKNIFVFLPMFFSGNLINREAWIECLIVFFSFSFVASSIYCLNDIRDVEADRRHPKKRFRPVASGRISIGVASIIMVLLLLASLMIAWFALPQTPAVTLIIGGYFLLNVAYCFRLKQVAIIDVFIVSVGFVLRVIAGGIACGIWISPWLVCMTFLLALFLAFAKRRDDVVLMERKGIIARRNIIRYNSDFLNQTLGIIGAVTMMSYIMYSVSPEVVNRMQCDYVYISSVFVLAGILRYLQLAIVDFKSGSPTKILMKDKFIQLTVVCWILTFIGIIYL